MNVYANTSPLSCTLVNLYIPLSEKRKTPKEAKNIIVVTYFYQKLPFCSNLPMQHTYTSRPRSGITSLSCGIKSKRMCRSRLLYVSNKNAP